MQFCSGWSSPCIIESTNCTLLLATTLCRMQLTWRTARAAFYRTVCYGSSAVHKPSEKVRQSQAKPLSKQRLQIFWSVLWEDVLPFHSPFKIDLICKKRKYLIGLCQTESACLVGKSVSTTSIRACGHDLSISFQVPLPSNVPSLPFQCIVQPLV